MEIALLLRGQPRFSKSGAVLFKKFIENKFYKDGLRVKIFISTWRSVSNIMTAADLSPNINFYPREFDQSLLDRNKVINEELIPWAPLHYRIEQEHDLFNLVTELVCDAAKDSDLVDWIDTHYRGVELDGWNNTATMFVNPNTKYKKDKIHKLLHFGGSDPYDYELMASALRVHYVLGQIYSGSKSYDSYLKYKEKHPDYNPDLIISSRLDAFHWVDDYTHLVNLLNFCRAKNKAPHYNNNSVMIEGVSIIRGYPVISDYNFYMTPENADMFFKSKWGSIEENLKHLFTTDKHKLISLFDSGPTLQHALWTVVHRDCSFIPLPQHIRLKTNVLRPSNDFNFIENCDNSHDSFLKITRKAVDYWYPAPNTSPTEDMILSLFNLMRDN